MRPVSADRGALGQPYRRLFAGSVVSNLGDGIGTVAYPWLATAITRDPLLIALVAVAQRLPWLVFSLPAGVITDRYDRRLLMVSANLVRATVALVVGAVVLAAQGTLPALDALGDADTVIETRVGLYLVLVAATLVFGVAEVLHDNAAQTFMPALVSKDQLERANGRLWSAEQTANTFAGPPIGALLLATAFALPFFVDALSFAVSAWLVWLVSVPRPSSRTSATTSPTPNGPWWAEMIEGFRWLWRHDFLRPLAIILGLLNGIGALSLGIFVLFAQEVLGTSPTQFALVMTGGAFGGIIGGWSASAISRRLGSGPSLWLTLLGSGATSLVIGLSSWWPLVWLMLACGMGLGVLWNVITVSLRQTIIPDHLLGRVNSVYRFFAWGSIPIASFLGGALVLVADATMSREAALRLPWLVAAALNVALFAFAAPRLTTQRIEAARRDEQ